MTVIIVGGVAGGASCAARLWRLDENAETLPHGFKARTVAGGMLSRSHLAGSL